MTIGQLAAAASVPISTLRFYERSGLLAPRGRTRAGYRVYDEGDAERVRFLKRAQELGFTLRELKLMLAMSRSTKLKRRDLDAIGAEKLAEIDARIVDLRRVRRAISGLLAQDCIDPEAACPIVASLGNMERRKRASTR
jgi:DNA-binding transcriptional MerR regulator